MGKLGSVVLLIAQFLVFQAMAHETETQAPLSGLSLNPLEHKTQIDVQFHDHDIVEDHKAAQAPHIRKLGKHHSTDKSVAGGGAIIGGLVTAMFASVFCYIRVTRKMDSTGY